MDEIVAILNEIKSGVDFENEDQIVTGKILDSIDITNLIAKLEDRYDIEIGMEYLDNEYFDSAEAIWNMVQELRDL
ncbi:MAG: acyl carrier protein [Clostridia bacterium]|nr:acyl carrier protein [Clostridia bacterium]MBQ5757504.1 acyl carrier protein [Clostridia bacterium]